MSGEMRLGERQADAADGKHAKMLWERPRLRRLRVPGFRALGLWASDLGFRVADLGFRVYGSGF